MSKNYCTLSGYRGNILGMGCSQILSWPGPSGACYPLKSSQIKGGKFKKPPYRTMRDEMERIEESLKR